MQAAQGERLAALAVPKRKAMEQTRQREAKVSLAEKPPLQHSR